MFCSRFKFLVSVLLLVLLVYPSEVSAQKRRVPIEEDNHAFRFILNSLGLEPLTNSDQIYDEPDKTILIVFGDTEILESLDLMKFVDEGGAVFVATDRRSSDRFQKDFGARVTGNRVVTEKDSGYRSEAECPFVKPREDSEIAKTLFSGRQGFFRQLATNRPSVLSISERKLEPLAFYPRDCWIDILPFKARASFFGRLQFAAGAEIENGRVLILADHSVFINSMMLQPDNDNFNFAYNCVHWLTEGKEGKRTKALFYDDGEIVSDFKVPVKVIKEFPIPPIEVMDQLLAKVEEENIFNRLLLGPNPRARLQLILQILAVSLTAGLVLAGCYWLMQNRHRFDVKAPLSSKTVPQPGPTPAIMSQRHQALIQQNNYWEVGRDLSREWFSDRLKEIGQRSPRIIIRSSRWRRRNLEKKVNALWKLAYGPPRKLNAGHFAGVVADLAQVEAAWADESLRFEE